MKPALGHALADHIPAIKTGWMHRLRDEPRLSALGRPDTVGHLIDATLIQLCFGLDATATEEWLKHCRPVVGPVHNYCACGLGPVQRYFVAGEEALLAAAALAPAAGLAGAVEKLRILGRHEMDTLCAGCPHPAAAGICLKLPVVQPST